MYAFLFAGIGEYVVCAGTSAYGLEINMLYVILFNFLRQCVRVVSLYEGFKANMSCVRVPVHMV